MLTTYAESSGHLLEEIWRKDHTSFRDIGENALQNIYRAVRVRLHRASGDRFDVDVEVAKARSNTSEMEATDPSHLRKGGKRMPRKMTFDELRIKGDIDSPIVPLGWDYALADRIARDIRAASGLPAEGLAPLNPAKRAE